MTPYTLMPYVAAISKLEGLWREADEKLAEALAFAKEQGFSRLDQNHIEYAKQHVGMCTQFAHTNADADRRYWDLCNALDQDLRNERWQNVVRRGGPRHQADAEHDAPILANHPHRVWIICSRTHAQAKRLEYLTRREPFGHALFAARNVLFQSDDPVFAVAPGQ